MGKFDMTAVVDRATTIDGLIDEGLLAELMDGGLPEIVEPSDEVMNDFGADIDLDELIGDEVAAGLSADVGDTVLPVATSEEASADEAPVAKKAKKEKKQAAPKAPKAAKAPKEPKAPKEAKAPKEPKAPAVTYVNSKRSQVLLSRLGAKANDYLLLEAGDLQLSEEEQNAKRQSLLSFIDSDSAKSGGEGGAVKVIEKAVMLFGWMASGKPVSELNEVMRRSFAVLLTDGELTSGDKGNLQVDLLAKPYSMGTARSQANQMFMLFPLLKITVKEKGRMVANPDSLILMKMKAELGL